MSRNVEEPRPGDFKELIAGLCLIGGAYLVVVFLILVMVDGFPIEF